MAHFCKYIYINKNYGKEILTTEMKLKKTEENISILEIDINNILICIATFSL